MNRKVNVSKEELEQIVKDSLSVYDVLRKLGLKLAGGSHSYWSRKIKEIGIDTSHFLGAAHSRGKQSSRRISANEILVLRECGIRQKANKLVRALLERGREHQCEKCGQLPFWMGHSLTLDVDHINENWLDDREENLRFLCPNCHSQFSRNLLGG